MASQSLFEDCQHLIEKGQESWKSFFSKWENIGKQEENIPENILLNDSNNTCKPAGKKKKQTIPQTKRKKTKSILTYKKNLRNKRKIIKRKKIPPKKSTQMKLITDSSKENEATVFEGAVLESNLKKLFRNILIENRSKLEIFGVLSLTFSNSLKSNIHNLYLNHQLALPYDSQLNERSVSCINQFHDIRNSLDNPMRLSYTENFKGIMDYPKSYDRPLLKTRINHTPGEGFTKFEFHIKKSLNKAICVSPSQKTTPEINMSIKNTQHSLLRSPSYERSELNSPDLNSYHKSPISSCQRMNREYSVKRKFPKMTVTLDRKRFKDLYLQKKTNGFNLSMENSNFTTPESKPLERKCFSENVSQQKRRRLSELFFYNEDDDESDDQTEKRTPVIRCKNGKTKIERATEVLESDSDECESIFDRVK